MLAVGVSAPACVGLVLLLRLARHPGGLDPAGRRAVGRGGNGRRRRGEPRADDDLRSAAGAWALALGTEWVVLFLWPLALAYVFPDGRLPSPRWRVPAAVALVSAGRGAAPAPAAARGWTVPRGEVPNPLVGGADFEFLAPVFWVCWFGLLSLFGGVLALRARYRAGSRELRRQVLWLAYGALLAPLWLGGIALATRVFGELISPTCSC